MIVYKPTTGLLCRQSYFPNKTTANFWKFSGSERTQSALFVYISSGSSSSSLFFFVHLIKRMLLKRDVEIMVLNVQEVSKFLAGLSTS